MPATSRYTVVHSVGSRLKQGFGWIGGRGDKGNQGEVRRRANDLGDGLRDYSFWTFLNLTSISFPFIHINGP